MILEAHNINKIYKRNGSDFSAVDDVSLFIDSGDFVCISGRSGSGKSTLLNILTGLLTPSSGDIYFGGEKYEDLNDDQLSKLRHTKLGYIMQGYSVLPNFTVLQNVILPYVLAGRQDSRLIERASSILEQVGLDKLVSQYPSNLSGGELRRVSIARALLSSPKLLIADEPTGDLDDETTDDIMKLFAQLAENGTAVLMVTHDTDAASYGNKMYCMKKGQLICVSGDGKV